MRPPFAKTLIFALLLLFAAGCRAGASSTANDRVTVIILTPTPVHSASPTRLAPPTATGGPVASPTIDWSQVTLLPLHSPEPTSPVSPIQTVAPTEQSEAMVPDVLTEKDVHLLAAGRPPFSLSDVEVSLGRILLPLDLLDLAPDASFQVTSLPIEGFTSWRFLTFDIPTPAEGDLGAIVRAPIGGTVLEGTMQMVNDQTVSTVSIDHPLDNDQLIRATLVYSGTIDPLYMMGQEVQVGDVLFRLTRDTGRLNTLGSNPIPGGATFTLHASIDSIVRQESGVETLKFLRGISLTPAGFARQEYGLIISPVN